MRQKSGEKTRRVDICGVNKMNELVLFVSNEFMVSD